MPTPPPWCTDTHDAPDAVDSSAFRIGQSAIASEPSSMASVSRNGDATEPVSRWSRPITTGADTSPSRTSRLNSSPALARSPWPSQQMREGSPWKAIRSGAIASQRCSSGSSGNESISARSMRWISAGSPDSAAQRKGPAPTANSGRM